MKLTTNRLVIREFEKKDIPVLIENINDLEVSQYLLLVPYPYRLKDANWWINKCQEEAKKKPRATYDFAIELKSEKRLVGGIGLNHADYFQNTIEIGFWLGKRYWKQGIMSEAITAMLDFAFDKLKMNRINWYAYADNVASNALAKKMGFVFEGTRRKAARAKSTGKIHDDNVYGLLKDDWLKIKR
jgi:RimJ/RimL family protein N-acetyltransferase